MATDKLVARVDWRPLLDDQLGLHELVVWGCPTIGPEATAPFCRLLTDRDGWAGPVANFQLFQAIVVLWKSIEQLNQATLGVVVPTPFPAILAIGLPNQQTVAANRRAVDDARAVARQLTRDLFNERRRAAPAAAPTLVLPGEEGDGADVGAGFGELDIFSAAGIVGTMARGTWEKERDRFYLYRRGTLFDAKALFQWGETNRARVAVGQEPLPLPSELEPYKKREAAKPIAWAAAGAGVAAAVIAGGYYGIKSRGRRSNPSPRRQKPRRSAPPVSGGSRRRAAKANNPRRKAAQKTNPRREAKRANPRAKGWIGKVDREMAADDTEGDFTAQARRAGYANTLTYARAVMRGWRSGKKTVLNKKKRRQQGITLRTMRRANFALNAQKRKRNPTKVRAIDTKRPNPRTKMPRAVQIAKLYELELYIDNVQPLYERKMAMWQNLVRKLDAGKYSRAKAPKLFRYLADDAAKRYAKEFGYEGGFDVFTRNALSKNLVEEFEGEVKSEAQRPGSTHLKGYRYKKDAGKPWRVPNPGAKRRRRNPDENESRLTINEFRDRVELSDADGYRAAYLGEHCLTAPYHATLSDRDLLAEAEAEALRADIIIPNPGAKRRRRNEAGGRPNPARKRSATKSPRKARRETKAAWIRRMTGPRRGKKSLTRKQAEGLWKGAHAKKRGAA
jgi:hypothetical protein